MHSNHDRSSGLPYCNDQVLVQYDMLLVHAFPMAVAVYPLKQKKKKNLLNKVDYEIGWSMEGKKKRNFHIWLDAGNIAIF